jgi:hypothetical protein
LEMAATVLEYVALDDERRTAVRTLPKLRADDRVEIVVRHSDGSTETAALPTELANAVRSLVDRVCAGGRVAVLEEEQEISPNDAARILGMSRPLVVRRMDVGDLPFRYEGSHRRCKLRDVLSLKESEDQRQRAIEALAEDTEDLIANHGLS